MLKSILIGCVLSVWAPFAMAETELSMEWSRVAAELSIEVQNALEGQPLEEEHENDLMHFAMIAERLARTVSTLEGGEDLVCIFRGMADEVDLQLRLLHMPGERQEALRRLAAMLHDAERIGLAAAYVEARGNRAPPEYGAPFRCEADPGAAYQYLTEQP